MPNFLDEKQIEALGKHLMVHIKPTIETVIQEKVNGKIDRIDKKLDEYIGKDIEWKKDDAKWKEEMKPVKEIYDGSKGFFSGSAIIAKWLGAIGAGVAAFIYLRDKL